MVAALALTTSAPLLAQQRDTARSTSADSARRLRPGQLETVRVSGARLSAVDRRVPQRVDALDPQSVAPGPTAATALLSSLPGVSVFDDQGSHLQPEINLRGFVTSPIIGEPQAVSVFLDGVRINEPDAQEVNFDLLPMDAVQRAELVRGPSAVFGKNSIAGSLLLFTERGGDEPTLSTGFEAGSFGYRGARVTAAGRVGGFDAFVMARAGAEDGWRQDTPARIATLFGNLGWRSRTTDVFFSTLAARNRIHEAGSLPESYLALDRRVNYTPGDFYHPNLLHLALHGERRGGAGVLRASIFARDNAIDQYNVNVPPPNTSGTTRNRSAGVTAEWTRLVPVGTRPLTLTVGGEYEHDDVRYRFVAVTAPGVPADSASAADIGCDPMTAVCTLARVRGDNGALFAQGVLELTSRLSLTAAARGDYVRIPYRDLLDAGNSGTSTYYRLSPRLGLSFRPADPLRTFVTVNTGFRAPAPLELACASAAAACSLPSALGADPPLKPVVVVDYEAGADWSRGGGPVLSATAFASEVRNDILFVQPSATTGFFQNVGATRRAGVELTGSVPLPAGLRMAGSYSYTAATYQTRVHLASALEGEPPVQSGDRLPLSPAHRGTIGLDAVHTIPAGMLSGGISMRAVSSQYLRGDEANRLRPLPGFAVADGRFRLALRHVALSIDISNLFDRQYANFGIYALNVRGDPGSAGTSESEQASIERFLTPGLPRSLLLSVSLTR